MKVLVACECSGRVRDAFIARGHDAVSCDLVPTRSPGPHYQGDVRDVLSNGWDMMIAHPPCTHLAVSGSRWFAGKEKEQAEALAFVRLLLAAPIRRIAVENPVSIISTAIRKPDQVVNPFDFGEPWPKKTCLWLKGLQPLVPTNRVAPLWEWHGGKRYSPLHDRPDRSDGMTRQEARSITFAGIAAAMADQWGDAPKYCFDEGR